MNIIILGQAAVTLLLAIVLGFYAAFTIRKMRLKRLFSQAYIKAIQVKTVSKLYPLVPRPNSSRYRNTKRFLISIGWGISVEGIYLLKWVMFATILFIFVTMQNTNRTIELEEMVKDVNFNRNMVQAMRVETQENNATEKQLYELVNKNIEQSKEIFKKQNKQMYIGYIEHLISQQDIAYDGDLKSTAKRLYEKVLQARILTSDISSYIYILLISILAYYLPDILGQLKKKLIEDKKNWEILSCLIVFSIYGRMPPFSVLTILEHMVIATEVYRPLLEALIEGLKKGGKQEEAFDAALEAVDRDELYELIETMKIARRTGLVNSVDDVDDTITNTIKWIEIENISRRRTKMLYAMTAMAVVMGIGCIYFAYGLTVISNPTNLIMK